MTRRTACAQSVITMKPETLRMICEDRAPQAMFSRVAIAGIMAAKRRASLSRCAIPSPSRA
ncbi:MAG: cyclic pyranopterin monophosphate synthase MoaC [Butyricicoccaceae bacterium]